MAAAEVTVCTECGKRYRTDQYAPGKRIRCKACGEVLTVGEAADDAGRAFLLPPGEGQGEGTGTGGAPSPQPSPRGRGGGGRARSPGDDDADATADRPAVGGPAGASGREAPGESAGKESGEASPGKRSDSSRKRSSDSSRKQRSDSTRKRKGEPARKQRSGESSRKKRSDSSRKNSGDSARKRKAASGPAPGPADGDDADGPPAGGAPSPRPSPRGRGSDGGDGGGDGAMTIDLDAGSAFPLPPGEGQGEGKIPGGAPSPQPSPRGRGSDGGGGSDAAGTLLMADSGAGGRPGPSMLRQIGAEAGVTPGGDSEEFFDDVTIAGEGGGGTPAFTVADLLATSEAKGRYAVDREIARGGMGAILRSVDRDLRRVVAMKVMLRDLDEQQKLRFVEEAQVCAQLSHPNIPPVHEMGFDEEGRLYFTMKLVKGRSLGDVLSELAEHPRTAEARFGLHKLLTVFVKVCDAMAFAHSRGVVHRDLKPENVMVGDYGEVLVMDWGLAKVGATRQARASTRLADGGREAQAAADAVLAEQVQSLRRDAGSDLTLDGQVAGTPQYMPPEQAEGRVEDIDERSDIYALGAILYEILCLRPPVQGKTVYDTLQKAADGDIKPPGKRAGRHREVPKDLAAIAMQALATDRDDRYDAVEALKRDVELFLEGRGVSAREAGLVDALGKLVKRNKGASIAAAVAAVLLAGVLAWSYSGIRAERDRAVQALARFEEEREARKQEEAERHRAEAETREAETASASVLYDRARTAARGRRFDEAGRLLTRVLEYEPEHADANLMAAFLAVRDRDWATAADAFERCAALDGFDIRIRALVGRCRRMAREGGDENDYNDVVRQMGDYGFDAMAMDLLEDREAQERIIRERLESAWPDGGWLLLDLPEKGFILRLNGIRTVSDLRPLQGLPLESIDVRQNPHKQELKDLSPLKDMPLRSLFVGDATRGAGVKDLSPLKGMPLEHLELNNTEVEDLTPLAGVPLRELDISGTGVRELSPLKGMPLEALHLPGGVRDISALEGMRLRELTGGSYPQEQIALLKNMPLEVFKASDRRIDSFAFLKGKPMRTLWLARVDVGKDGLAALGTLHDLEDLRLDGMDLASLPSLSALTKLSKATIGKSRNIDLMKLHGLRLWRLQLVDSDVADLSGLAGMDALEALDTSSTDVSDLSPLRGLKGLKSLNVASSRVSDLSPLTGLDTLKSLLVYRSDVTDLSPLRGLKGLNLLNAAYTEVTDLSPLTEVPLEWLDMTMSALRDLSPLAEMKTLKTLYIRVERNWLDLAPLAALRLEQVYLHPGNVQNIEVLRKMASLKRNGASQNPGSNWAPAEFWKRYDAGEFAAPGE